MAHLTPPIKYMALRGMKRLLCFTDFTFLSESLKKGNFAEGRGRAVCKVLVFHIPLQMHVSQTRGKLQNEEAKLGAAGCVCVNTHRERDKPVCFLKH